MVKQECCSGEGVSSVDRLVVVEKSVVATVAYVCLWQCPELAGAGRRVEYHAAAGRQSPSKHAASERKRGREWIKGILWLDIVARSRMCVRRGCVQGVLLLHPISLSLSLPISPKHRSSSSSSSSPTHTSLDTNGTISITPHPAREGFSQFAGSLLANARGSRLARPRSELCTRQPRVRRVSYPPKV